MRVGNETLGEDGRVGLLLLWDTPSEGDLPLHHYKVTWTPRHAPRHAAGHDRKDNARVTDGVRSGFVLHLTHVYTHSY